MTDVIRLSDKDGSFGFLRGQPPRPPNGGPPWYSANVTVRKVDENSTAQTVTGTVTETTIASLDLPALTLASTGAMRLSATGIITQGTTQGVTFRIKAADDTITDTVLATTAIKPASSTSPHAWGIEFLILGKQPSVNRGWGYIDIATAGAGGTFKPSTYSAVGFSTMGLDETEEWTISITAQLTGATTGLAVTRQVAILEAMN